MGKLAWGRRTNGVLSQREAKQLLRGVIRVQARDLFDRVRRKLGLLRPADIELADLEPPDSKLSADARTLAESSQPRALLLHCWRTYYFGVLIAKYDRMDFDPELFFAASMLHDIGMTAATKAPRTACCFAVSGAIHAYEQLTARGHAPLTATRIGDAISLHMNLDVGVDCGAEAFMLARGAVCDVFGAGLARISTPSVQAVIGRCPREDLRGVLFVTDHLAGTRTALLNKLARGTVPPHPLDGPRRARGY
ncbi:MAG: hypothetical protein QM778_22340 [Myxococcales bacterium]